MAREDIRQSSRGNRSGDMFTIMFILMASSHRKILIGKKPVFYQTWYDAGITKISDILNQNQKFLKWHEFVTKFNLNVPFTTYYGLVNAIPKDWKAILTNPIPNVTHANTTVNSLRNSSIYSSI